MSLLIWGTGWSWDFQKIFFDLLNYSISDVGTDSEEEKLAFTAYLPCMLGTLYIHYLLNFKIALKEKIYCPQLQKKKLRVGEMQPLA